MTNAVKWGLWALVCVGTACDSKDSGDSGKGADDSDGSRTITDGACTATGLEGAGQLPLVAVRFTNGPFTMGADDDPEAAPAHEVTLTQRFFLSATEITQGQWTELGFANPSQNTDCDDCPVEQVTWHEAAAYANAVSESEGYGSCYTCEGLGAEVVCAPAESPYTCEGWRLPTEAEWEFAAGQDAHRWAGSDDFRSVAWTGESVGRPCPVGGLTPTELAVYDLSGNVSEWTHDGFAAYESGPTTDPTGDASAVEHAVRGGSFFQAADRATVTAREGGLATEALPWRGFRLARTLL